MSVFRRHLMMAFPLAQSKDYGYIKDGLVFHLDGIDKGPNEGKWTDLVGGVVFENHGAVPLYDSWRFDNEGSEKVYMFSDLLNYPADTHTIEVTLLDQTSKYIYRVFCAGANTSICFVVLKNEASYYSSVNPIGAGIYKFSKQYYKSGINRVSCAKLFSVCNGVNIQGIVNRQGTISEDINAVIGDKSNTANNAGLTGKIYSIRIYNRLLTEEEMRHNQEVDYERFDLANAIHNDAISQISSLEEVDSPQNIVFPSTTYHTLTDEEIALAASKGWSVVSA